MSANNGGTAFPAPDLGEQDFGQRGAYAGMTLRDYFAAKAIQGIQSCPAAILEPDGTPGPDPLKDADIARLAYALADAMLAAREAS